MSKRNNKLSEKVSADNESSEIKGQELNDLIFDIKFNQIKEAVMKTIENSGTFIATLTAAVTICWLLIKCIFYFFEAGKFNIWQLNRMYINISESSFVFQIIQNIALVFVMLLINILVYKIIRYKSVKSDHKRISYTIIKIGIYILMHLVMIFVFIVYCMKL